ncbi:MAG: hypothetical protein H6556_17960 [Lewinellaceae bacterium]|nr:hypothetical protein [Lewinellaceae bacterium]
MMETRPAPLSLFRDIPQEELQHKVLLVPEVAAMIRALMPALLSQNEETTSLLDRINRYLFEQKKLKEPVLENELPPELYTALYGLKSLVQKHGLTRAQLILENSKQRFAAFLDEELNG